MSVTSREVLASDSGHQLPAVVRGRLVDLGVAANHAALAVAQAALLETQCLAVQESEQAQQRQGSQVAETAGMLWQCALQHYDQLVMGYAIVAARYAVYAAHVADGVTSAGPVTDVDVADVLPSQLIENLDRRLPQVRFPARSGSATIVEEQNDAIAEARDHLSMVIQRQMFGSAVTDYDSVDAAPRPKGSTDLVVDFPVALHDYAATVTWAVGVFASSDQPTTR